MARQLAIDTKIIGVDEILDGEVSLARFEIPEDLDIKEWAHLGRRIYRIHNASLWWLGMWWRYAMHRVDTGLYREDDVFQAAPLGYKSETLQRAAKVCARIPPEERDERLSFSHYVVLSRVREPQPRGRIRDKAIRENWTVRDTEVAVTQANAGNHRSDELEVVHAPICKGCHRLWPCPDAPERR
jgi:hypothetical protein